MSTLSVGRSDYPAKLIVINTIGPPCPKCGGRCPGRVCRHCGKLPVMTKASEGYVLELSR